MPITLIIYLIGYVLSTASFIYFAVKYDKKLTLFNVILALFLGVFSWIGVIAAFLFEANNIVLWKSKEENNLKTKIKKQ